MALRKIKLETFFHVPCSTLQDTFSVVLSNLILHTKYCKEPGQAMTRPLNVSKSLKLLEALKATLVLGG